MTRHGQIMHYGGLAPEGEHTIINNEDYKLKVTKTKIEATNVWHLKFHSQSVYDSSWECFLTDEELRELRRVL